MLNGFGSRPQAAPWHHGSRRLLKSIHHYDDGDDPRRRAASPGVSTADGLASPQRSRPRARARPASASPRPPPSSGTRRTSSGRRLARRRAECVTVLQGRNIDHGVRRLLLPGRARRDGGGGPGAAGTASCSRRRRPTGPREADVSRVLGHGAVDGALVAGALDAGLLLALRHRGLPMVLVDNHAARRRTSRPWCPTTRREPVSRPRTSSGSAIGGSRSSARP